MFQEALLSLLLTYKYWLLLPFACVEGPLVALLAGFLISGGHLSWLPTFIILVLGDFIPDMLFYGIGRWGHRQHFVLKHFGSRLPAIEKLWREHTFKAVLIAKWALGLTPPLLMTAGLARIPLRRYLLRVVPLSMATYSVLLVLGFQFGLSFQVIISRSIEAVQIVIAVAVAIVILGFWIASHTAKRSLPPPP